jgi:hypothetical protein
MLGGESVTGAYAYFDMMPTGQDEDVSCCY